MSKDAPAGPTVFADAALVRTTFAAEAPARAAARRLVERGLAACCHVTHVASCYAWEGRVVEEGEWLVEARVVGDPAGAAAALLEGHPYSLPLLEVVPSRVSAPYAAWAREATAGTPAGPSSEAAGGPAGARARRATGASR